MAVHFTQQPCASLVGLSISVRFSPLSLCSLTYLVSRLGARSRPDTGVFLSPSFFCNMCHPPSLVPLPLTHLASSRRLDRWPLTSKGFERWLLSASPNPPPSPARCARRNTLPPYLACCVGVRTASGFLSACGMTLCGCLRRVSPPLLLGHGMA